MQNYLQKALRKNRVKRVWAIPVLAAVTALAALLLLHKYGLTLREQENTSAYSPSFFSALSHLPEGMDGKETENDTEMNNLSQKNAKSTNVLNKNAPSCYKCSEVRVLQKDGSVKNMELEEYVTGCVLGEMPLGFEPQALMAQCIAIRTFTVRQSTCGKSKHKNADVCTDFACCQSYVSPESKNASEEKLKKLKDAVNATKGIIMLYDGEPIEAVYHASSGESTLDSEDVWGNRVEYLRSVPSPEGEAELASVVYGHRVGMSQQGANLLAKEGKNYTEILKYYYTGIGFGFLT